MIQGGSFMSKTGIVTDSHSSIHQEMAEELGIMVLPMPFYINGKCYYEGENITHEEFIDSLEKMEDISTSQPSPEAVMQSWDKALEKYDDILYIPISSGLSGSCSTAMAMAQDEKYAGKVYVVDNGRVATLLHQSVLDAMELLEQGCSAAEVKERLEKAKEKMGIYIAVDNLKYLKRGGRISSGVAVVGEMLKVKPILQFDIGTLDMFKKCRGLQKAKSLMIEEVKKVLETKYSEEMKNGDVHLLAASSASKEEAEKWVDDIKAAFPGMEVLYGDLSFGVTCHIGPGGLGIGYSCRP